MAKLSDEELLLNAYTQMHTIAELYGEENDMLKAQSLRAEILKRMGKVDVAGCIKCGGTDIHTAWHKNENHCGGILEPKFKGEHLHKHCRNCAYEWPEPVLSSQGKTE
jgi:hypothetical protein